MPMGDQMRLGLFLETYRDMDSSYRLVAPRGRPVYSSQVLIYATLRKLTLKSKQFTLHSAARESPIPDSTTYRTLDYFAEHGIITVEDGMIELNPTSGKNTPGDGS